MNFSEIDLEKELSSSSEERKKLEISIHPRILDNAPLFFFFLIEIYYYDLRGKTKLQCLTLEKRTYVL